MYWIRAMTVVGSLALLAGCEDGTPEPTPAIDVPSTTTATSLSVDDGATPAQENGETTTPPSTSTATTVGLELPSPVPADEPAVVADLLDADRVTIRTTSIDTFGDTTQTSEWTLAVQPEPSVRYGELTLDAGNGPFVREVMIVDGIDWERTSDGRWIPVTSADAAAIRPLAFDPIYRYLSQDGLEPTPTTFAGRDAFTAAFDADELTAFWQAEDPDRQLVFEAGSRIMAIIDHTGVVMSVESDLRGSQVTSNGDTTTFHTVATTIVEIGGTEMKRPSGADAVDNAEDLLIDVALRRVANRLRSGDDLTPAGVDEMLGNHFPYTVDTLEGAGGTVIGFAWEEPIYLLVAESESGAWFCLTRDLEVTQSGWGFGTSRDEADEPDECMSSRLPPAFSRP